MLATSSSEEDFMQDLSEFGVEILFCVLAPFTSLGFLIVLLSTLAVKHYMMIPLLNKYFKRTYLEREDCRRRRLRDSLKDPLLLMNLENRMLKAYGGDQQKAVECMGRFRIKAEQEISPEDDMKGEEKKMTADALWKGTLFGCILLLFMLNVNPSNAYSNTGTPVTVDSLDSRRYTSNSLLADQRKLRQPIVVVDTCFDSDGFVVQMYCIAFCLVHLIHTRIVGKTLSGRKRRRSKQQSQKPNKEGARMDELEQPLLLSNNYETESEPPMV